MALKCKHISLTKIMYEMQNLRNVSATIQDTGTIRQLHFWQPPGSAGGGEYQDIKYKICPGNLKINKNIFIFGIKNADFFYS